MIKNKKSAQQTSALSCELFQCAGLAKHVRVTDAVREQLRLPTAEDNVQWQDLMWVVRGVLTGLMPTTGIRTDRGLANVATFYSLASGSPEPDEHRIAVRELDDQTILVALPEELPVSRP